MHQSKAIVLHQIKYSESSLIVKIYTQEEGLLSFIVKGVRGKKGKLRAAQFQTLNLLELTYQKSKKSQLRLIKDLKILEPFTELLFDPVKRSVGIFIAELIQQCIKEEEPNDELFDFLYSSIHWLDLTSYNCSHFHLVFMMKLTKYLGFYPTIKDDLSQGYFDLQQGVYTQQKPIHAYSLESEELEAWKGLVHSQFENMHLLSFSNALKRSLVQALMMYYKLHLIHFKELNSHHILQTVFNDE
ncbi:MAG: DNA repair protein RecO [Flavobacteriales bacterium]|nr:DNA repair protein RecO [Flavobacteriales bacterium]